MGKIKIHSNAHVVEKRPSTAHTHTRSHTPLIHDESQRNHHSHYHSNIINHIINMSESTFKAEIRVADRLSVQHSKKESDIHIITTNGTEKLKTRHRFCRFHGGSRSQRHRVSLCYVIPTEEASNVSERCLQRGRRWVNPTAQLATS